MRPILALLLLGFLPLTARENPKVLAHQVVDQVNWARRHPKEVAAVLKGWLPLFREGKFLSFPGEPRLHTQEGAAAVEEAIGFLERQQPVAPLELSHKLEMAAEDLAKDQSGHGGVGHQGSDGSLPWDRIGRYGTASGGVGEVVTYGSFGEPADPRRAVLSLIVDDGVPSRGHRTAVFDSSYSLAGAAWASHPIFTRMVVVDFAGGFYRDLEPKPGAARRKDFALAIIDELNQARQNPKGCARKVKAWLAYFQPDRVLVLPGERPVQTLEGVGAVKEAVALLEQMKPLPPVQRSQALTDSAEELASSEAASGAVGNEQGDLSLKGRLSRHGVLNAPCGEAIAYGEFQGPGGPEKAFLALLIQDGSGDRRTLRLLMDPAVLFAGVAWDTHPRYGNTVVLDVSGRGELNDSAHRLGIPSH